MNSITAQYIAWHYKDGYKDLKNFCKTILSFVVYFFSVKTLLQTFFQPWRRIMERGQKGKMFSILQGFVVTTLMRIIGVIIRIIMLVVALVALIISCVIALVSLIVWPLLPILLVLIFIDGVLHFV